MGSRAQEGVREALLRQTPPAPVRAGVHGAYRLHDGPREAKQIDQGAEGGEAGVLRRQPVDISPRHRLRSCRVSEGLLT